MLEKGTYRGMNARQAAKKWHISKRAVKEICNYYGLKIEKGRYNIPDDLEPIYIPDRRYRNNPLRSYLYVCDAIFNKCIIIPKVIGSDEDEIKTVISVMSEQGLIRLIEGRPKDSLDYRDYVLGIDFIAWRRNAAPSNMHILTELISPLFEAGAKGVTSAFLESPVIT